MAARGGVVNLVVLLFFIVLGAVVEVLVSIALGALVCVIPLVLFAMFSPTSRSTPMARSLRQNPLTVLEVVVGGCGFMIMIGAGAAADLLGILIGFVLFIVGFALLAPKLRGMQRGVLAQPSPAWQTRPAAGQPEPAIPPGVLSPPPDAASSPTSPSAGPPPASAPSGPYAASPPPGAGETTPPVSERYCPACGAGNARVAGFCQKCGAPLPPAM
jgi:hypothetical protein